MLQIIPNRIKSLGLSVVGLVLPTIALAANLSDKCDIVRIAETITKVFGAIVVIVSTLMLLWSAFLFITGGGNEDTVKKARNYLIYALVGIAVAVFARFGIKFVISVIGGQDIITTCNTELIT